MSLTPKQQKVLEFISDYYEEHGYAPAQQEIADHFGFRSLGTVQDYLVRLQQHGYLDKEWNGKRALKVVAGKKDQATMDEPRNLLPLIGRVAAGLPIEAIEEHETVEVPHSMLKDQQDYFVLEVRGDSMIDDGILDGDYVVIRKQNRAENGETVVALVEGEATIKRFYRKRKHIELHPANPRYKPMVFRPNIELEIRGVLAGVIRHTVH